MLKQKVAFIVGIFLIVFSTNENRIVNVMFFWVMFNEILSPYIYMEIKIPIWIHSLILYFPMYIVIIYPNSNRKLSYDYFWIGIGIIIVCMLISWNWKEYKEGFLGVFSKIPISKSLFINKLFSSVLAIFSEEIFFRGFIIGKLKSAWHLESIVINAILFLYVHYINKWANKMFSIKKYISIFLLALALGTVFYYTNNIFICIFLHMIYNSSDFISLFKKSFIKKKTIDDLFDD